MRNFVFITCFVAQLAFGAWPALAQSRQEIRAGLIDMLGKMPETMGYHADLKKYGFSGNKLKLAYGHEQKIARDPVISGYIADLVLAYYDGNIVAAARDGALYGTLLDNGLTNISAREMKFYYQVYSRLLSLMSARDCGNVVKGRISAARLDQVLNRAMARLSEKTLKEYFRINHKALRTGVGKGMRRLSPADQTYIDTAIGKALRAEVEAHKDAKAIGRAMSNFQRANNPSACLAAQVYLGVILSMKGRKLELALIDFTSQ